MVGFEVDDAAARCAVAGVARAGVVAHHFVLGLGLRLDVLSHRIFRFTDLGGIPAIVEVKLPEG